MQRDLVLAAQPAQSAEALALRQIEALGKELPRPDQSMHYQRVRGWVERGWTCVLPS
jgi:hypothetical protein